MPTLSIFFGVALGTESVNSYLKGY